MEGHDSARLCCGPVADETGDQLLQPRIMELQLAERADISQTDALPGRRGFGLHVAVTTRDEPSHPFYELRSVRGMPCMEG
jgi:hypothetical protein